MGTQGDLGAHHLSHEEAGGVRRMRGDLVMSRPTMSWAEFLVWCDLTALQLRILSALRQDADKDLTAFPSVDRLAQRASGRGSAAKAVRALEKLGLCHVTREAGPGRSTRREMAWKPPEALLDKARENLEGYGKNAAYRLFWLHGKEHVLTVGWRGECWEHLWSSADEWEAEAWPNEGACWLSLLPAYLDGGGGGKLPRAPVSVRKTVYERMQQAKANAGDKWKITEPMKYLERAFRDETEAQYNQLVEDTKAPFAELCAGVDAYQVAVEEIVEEDSLVEALHALADDLDDEALILEAFHALTEELETPPDQCGLQSDTDRSPNQHCKVSKPTL